MEQQVGDFHEARMLGQLVDRIAAVEQDALVAVDIGDRALAAGGRGEAGIVGEHAGLAVELADVDDVGADRAFEHRIGVVRCRRLSRLAVLSVMRSASFIWSAMRARLSSRPSRTSTSKIPGEVVCPVSAARSGWASLPSLSALRSATSRTALRGCRGPNSRLRKGLHGPARAGARASSVSRAAAFSSIASGRWANRKRGAVGQLVEVLGARLQLRHGADEQGGSVVIDAELRRDQSRPAARRRPRACNGR